MKLEINHNSPLPLHTQIEKLIRNLIKLEKYSDGNNYIPKEVDLSNKLGVSRNTVRKAITKLVYEGLLERKKGAGTFVKKSEITTSLSDWHSFTHEMNDKGVPFQNIFIKAEYIKTDERLSKLFNIKEGRKVLKLERVRGIDGEAVVYFISWFHPRIELNDNDNFEKPLYEILEDKYSIIPKISEEKIKAKLASAKIANILNIKSASPILYREREVLDPGSRIIEYNIGYYRADRFTYSIKIKS